MKKLVALFITTFSFFANAEIVYGTKFPNEGESGPAVVAPAIKYTPSTKEVLKSDSSIDLSRFILPSPPQENAGSCLFMSTTGTIEWWLARRDNIRPISEGKYDLSERVLMNYSKLGLGDELVKNWRTDTVKRMNKRRYSIRNRDFRYTKGWFKRNSEGIRVKAHENEEGAEYGTAFNWIVEIDQVKAPKVHVPKFDRRVIESNANENQWAIGEASKDIVQKIKRALDKYRSPVNVIYNHYGYWHAVVIVGYDDNRSTEKCPFVTGYHPYMKEKAAKLRKYADEELKDPAEIKKAYKKARNYERKGAKVDRVFVERGGCSERGVFLVRDSTHPNEEDQIYDYDLNNTGEEKHYATKLVLREYSWMSVLGNHAFQIFPTK